MLTAKEGIGWSKVGLEKYKNELHDLVVEDGVLRGAVFNNKLLNVFVGRHRKHKFTKPEHEPELKKRKVVADDDIGSYDTSHVNVLVPGMIRAFHPSMLLQWHTRNLMVPRTLLHTGFPNFHPTFKGLLASD